MNKHVIITQILHLTCNEHNSLFNTITEENSWNGQRYAKGIS